MLILPMLINAMGGMSSSGASGAALASNRAMLPAATTSTANYVRQSRLQFKVPTNSDFSNVTVWYAGFGQNSGGEFSSPDSQSIRTAIEIGGGHYRSSADQECPADGLIGIGLPGLTLAAGDKGYVVTRAVGANTGSVARIIGHGTHVIFGEGAVNGTDTGLDFTDGNYGKNAVAAAPTVSGGNITACGVTSGGSGYAAGVSVYAYEVQPDGTIAQKTIGNATRTGDAITSITITSGTPPSGVAAWVSPTVVIGNRFSSTSQVYGPVCITGTPTNASAKSLIILLTSIEIGYTSTDNIGDFDRNHGLPERGLLNRCGTLNLASSSQVASSFRSTTTFAKTYELLETLGLSNAYCYMGAPTNDVVAGISETTTQSYMNEIKSNMAARNIVTDFAKFLPRTTDATTAATGFGAGGVAENLNTKIANGTIASTGTGFKDPRTQFENADPLLWNASYTTDWIHPNLAGLAFAGSNAAWTSQFAPYGNASSSASLLESGDNSLLESGDLQLLEG